MSNAFVSFICHCVLSFWIQLWFYFGRWFYYVRNCFWHNLLIAPGFWVESAREQGNDENECVTLKECIFNCSKELWLCNRWNGNYGSCKQTLRIFPWLISCVGFQYSCSKIKPTVQGLMQRDVLTWKWNLVLFKPNR